MFTYRERERERERENRKSFAIIIFFV